MRFLARLFFSILSLQLYLYGQSLEPRLYSNIPKDFNFLVTGYIYSSGALPENSSLKDPNIEIHSAFLAYARGLDIAGKSAKIDVGIPTACVKGDAIYNNNRVSRDICGLGDIKARFAYNFFGAPSTSVKNFASYKQDTIVGISTQVTIPTGQYSKDKLVNIGTNRWAFKVGTGVSKKISNFIFEFALDAEFYTKNKDFFIGTGVVEKTQDFIYSAQIHIIYTFPKGIWLALDTNYYGGGENFLNGEGSDDALDNSRTGLTFAVPLNKSYSLKIYGSSGVFTRAGTNFDTLGLALQYRFADGF